MFGAIAVLQSAVLVLVVTVGKGAPMGATALKSAVRAFGRASRLRVWRLPSLLFVSALAQNGNQVLPLTVVTLMVQVVLAGGADPVTDRVLDPLSWLTPARWGLAATASTDRSDRPVLVISKDSHWKLMVEWLSYPPSSTFYRCSTPASSGGNSDKAAVK